MGLESLIKREIKLTILVVLLVSTTFFAFSYALFKVEDEGETTALEFGDIKLSFCQNSTCDEYLANPSNIIGTTVSNGVTSYVPVYPLENVTVLNDGSTNANLYNERPTDYSALTPYTFTLRNDGTTSLYVTIKLEKDTTSNLSYTVNNVVYNQFLDEDEVMIAIGESGSTPTSMLYSSLDDGTGVHNLMENIVIASGESKTFNLYMWLRSDAENSDQGKYFVTNISAIGEFTPKLLPNEYQQLEYIESTGTQYIDTGYATESIYNYQIVFTPTNVTTEQDMGVTGSTPNWFAITNGKLQSFANNNFATITAGTKYKLDYGFVSTSPRAYINAYNYETNTLIGSLTYTTGPTTGKNVTLWKLGSYGGGIMKIYNFTLYNSQNVLTRDLIPCYRRSDGEVGMYDLVNQVFYTNAGTGEFIKGPNVNFSSEYQQVEYIESTGTQYIDTGYAFQTENSKIVADVNITSNSGYQTIFGSEEYYNSSNARYFSDILHGTNGNFYVYAGTGSNGTASIGLNSRVLIEYVTDNNVVTVKSNDTTLVSTTYSGSIRTGYYAYNGASNKGNIFIFANHQDASTGPTQIIGGMKLYSFKMYDNDELVRYFIPVYRLSDNKAGLYDLVNDKFYISPNGYEFTIGSNL